MMSRMPDTYDILAAALKAANIENPVLRERYYSAWVAYIEGPSHVAALQLLPNWKNIDTQPFELKADRPIVEFVIQDRATDVTDYLGWIGKSEGIHWVDVTFPVPSRHWLLAQCGDLADDTDFR